jgi:hypothetical protein
MSQDASQFKEMFGEKVWIDFIVENALAQEFVDVQQIQKVPQFMNENLVQKQNPMM